MKKEGGKKSVEQIDIAVPGLEQLAMDLLPGHMGLRHWCAWQ